MTGKIIFQKQNMLMSIRDWQCAHFVLGSSTHFKTFRSDKACLSSNAGWLLYFTAVSTQESESQMVKPGRWNLTGCILWMLHHITERYRKTMRLEDACSKSEVKVCWQKDGRFEAQVYVSDWKGISAVYRFTVLLYHDSPMRHSSKSAKKTPS